MERQRNYNHTWTTLEKKNKAGWLILPDFKNFNKATAIKKCIIGIKTDKYQWYTIQPRNKQSLSPPLSLQGCPSNALGKRIIFSLRTGMKDWNEGQSRLKRKQHLETDNQLVHYYLWWWFYRSLCMSRPHQILLSKYVLLILCELCLNYKPQLNYISTRTQTIKNEVQRIMLNSNKEKQTKLHFLYLKANAKII